MKTSWINAAWRRSVASLALIGAGLLAPAAHADELRASARNPAYQQECSSCHVAYPPRLLSAASWRAVMGGLDRHFGTDASLDPETRAALLRYLQANAGSHDTSAYGKPLLRITETRWFVHEHTGELPRHIWRNPAVKSPANCSACHTAADKGNYSESTLHVPGGVKK